MDRDSASDQESATTLPVAGRWLDGFDAVAGGWLALTFVFTVPVALGIGSGFGKNAAGVVLATVGALCVVAVAGLIGYREIRATTQRVVVSAMLLALSVLAIAPWLAIRG